MKPNGRAPKAKPGQIREYYRLRDIGLNIEQAARAAGDFSRSWGSQKDLERKNRLKLVGAPKEEEGPLEDAIDFIVSRKRRAQDEKNPADLIIGLTGLAYSLASERSVNLQCAFEALFHTEPWFREFAATPITAEEVLLSFKTQRQLDDDFSFWPPRLDGYVLRYAEKYGTTMREEIEESMIRNPRAMEVLKELEERIERGLTVPKREEVQHG